jgi:hypothetical protein
MKRVNRSPKNVGGWAKRQQAKRRGNRASRKSRLSGLRSWGFNKKSR